MWGGLTVGVAHVAHERVVILRGAPAVVAAISATRRGRRSRAPSIDGGARSGGGEGGHIGRGLEEGRPHEGREGRKGDGRAKGQVGGKGREGGGTKEERGGGEGTRGKKASQLGKSGEGSRPHRGRGRREGEGEETRREERERRRSERRRGGQQQKQQRLCEGVGGESSEGSRERGIDRQSRESSTDEPQGVRSNERE